MNRDQESKNYISMHDRIELWFDEYRNVFILLLAVVCVLNVFVWHSILLDDNTQRSSLYFLDVGQGDGSLVELEGGVQILIDGGRSADVVSSLERVLPPTDRYIDAVILSHPQADHMNGLIDVMERYDVGVFVHGAASSSAASYKELWDVIDRQNIYTIEVSTGDKIRYGSSSLYVLWPPEGLEYENVNEASVVVKLQTPNVSALFTGDIGKTTERVLSRFNVRSDVLKVPHHGSKYSSSEDFIKRVSPQVSVVEVGRNSYGHPTDEALDRLGVMGSAVFRTDRNGIVRVVEEGGMLKVYAER